MSQGSSLPLGNPAYSTIDRLSIKFGASDSHFNSIRPFRRGDLVRLADTVYQMTELISPKDQFDINYIYRDNNEWLSQSFLATTLTGPNQPAYKKVYVDSTNTFYRLEESTDNADPANDQDPRYQESKKPLLKYFYRTPANFFQVDHEFFNLRLNPILHFKYGSDGGAEEPVFYNRRGVEIRGGIDDRIFFYSNILETQARFPQYVNDWISLNNAIPGTGFYKRYQSDFFGIQQGYDFLLAQGYVGFNVTPHVGIQLGHGQNFLGNGYRSLFLSDFSNNYFYLKFNTRVWKIHYQNIFAELSAEGIRDNAGSTLLSKKYLAAHYLSYKPVPNLRFGLFEAIVFHRDNQFEWQYLNPVILYRTIEQGLDSPDNAFIGIDFSWNLLRRFQLYGQWIIDEFRFVEMVTDPNGWWGNKNGIQLGLKYIDMIGIDHLDGQIEYNSVRPYTYQHRDSLSNFTHYNQALAHPMGANFKEFLVRINYAITPQLVLSTRMIWTQKGEDEEGDGNLNYGGDLLRTYRNRNLNYGVENGQGIFFSQFLAGLDISYQVKHNIFLDLRYFHRNKDSDLDERDQKINYFEAGLRMNVSDRKYDF